MTSQQSKATAIVALVGLGVVLVFWRGGGNWPRGQTGASGRPLKHFDGHIEFSQRTHDPVLSDLCVRGAKALEDGDVATAEAIYRERVAKYPKDPSGYKALATALLFQKKYQPARAEYQAALEIDPNYADAHYGLGCVAYKEKRYPEAREHLEKAVAIDENDRSYHRVLAMVYDQLKDDAKALFHYERAAALRGDMPEDKHVMRRLNELKR